MMKPQYKIPTFLNSIAMITASFLYFFLMQLAAGAHFLLLKLLCAGAFAIVMIPVYSLIHEAEHGMLFENKALNLFSGRWLCCLFVAPYTFMKHCHLKHHKKNRTDEEMWDLYYEHQQKWQRYGNLYLMMMGFGYFAIWLSVLVFALAPGLVKHPLLRQHKEINGFLEGSDDAHKRHFTRVEASAVMLFQVMLLWWLHWNLLSWFLLLAVHGFVWSSQNYVNHAFSPRDIINGAHNLTMPVWLNFIYLNFNIHLAHHQQPQIPWVHLPRFIQSGNGRTSFFRNYLRLWKGPRLTHDQPPLTVKQKRYAKSDISD